MFSPSSGILNSLGPETAVAVRGAAAGGGGAGGFSAGGGAADAFGACASAGLALAPEPFSTVKMTWPTFTFFDADLVHRPADRGGNFDDRLVGFEFHHRLAFGDARAERNHQAYQIALRYVFAQLR
jgi:hypothetical protein